MDEQGDLFEWPLPPSGDRGGDTYEHEEDYARLNRQASDVWRAMFDKRWYTLDELHQLTGHPPASISARIRDFRKHRFGSHTVHRVRITGGLFAYQLEPNPATVGRTAGTADV